MTWFCVLSFQCKNRFNVINGQRNNENPLYWYYSYASDFLSNMCSCYVTVVYILKDWNDNLYIFANFNFRWLDLNRPPVN